jgi:hypothetical protein
MCLVEARSEGSKSGRRKQARYRQSREAPGSNGQNARRGKDEQNRLLRPRFLDADKQVGPGTQKCNDGLQGYIRPLRTS